MLKSREGQPVPNVTFPIRVDGEWQKVSSDALFKGKTVVLFALPGAFTPTCSSTHLPRFNELASAFKRITDKHFNRMRPSIDPCKNPHST